MVWQKGQSGNPLGRAVEKPWKDALARAIKRNHALLTSDCGPVFPELPIDPTVNAKGKTYIVVPEGQALELIADMCVQQALCGDLGARKEIGERLDGKVPQAIEGTDVPIIHTVRWLGDDDEPEDGK
jgi:hypothetical protein